MSDEPRARDESEEESRGPRDFVRAMVEADLEDGKYGDRVATRFPPEPNGYLHIGHAKSICLNFGLAEENGGTCNLRFDDTNPETEEKAFVEAIQEDVRWLGFRWDALCFASDYFERFYNFAVELVEKGLAYVDDSSEEEIRDLRGTISEPGTPSAGRARSPEENLELFQRMREGELADGSKVLRAKIDLAHPNMKMRDPVLYRVLDREHYRTGDAWKIYPLYDHAHCLSDAIENITHSLCTLEFENNRAIYDWILEHVSVPRPRPEQTEFARLELTFTVLSKRKLARLVEDGHVDGWDDPRMPTLSGLRRRGVTPEAIRAFCDAIGVSKANSVVDVAMLEHAIRDDLNYRAPRRLCVLDPLKVTVTNFPEGEVDWLDADDWPRDIPRDGTRRMPFSRNLWIERSDFEEEPPKKFFRLAPGREVRLRFGYFITCDEVVKDEEGAVVELLCSYDPETRGGQAPDGRRVKGTIHWVSADHGVPVEARLYDRLFLDERPEDLESSLNPDSLETVEAVGEPSLAEARPGDRYQFERRGYFYLDPVAQGDGGRPVVSRTVTLRDSWARRGR